MGIVIGVINLIEFLILLIIFKMFCQTQNGFAHILVFIHDGPRQGVYIQIKVPQLPFLQIEIVHKEQHGAVQVGVIEEHAGIIGH